MKNIQFLVFVAFIAGQFLGSNNLQAALKKPQTAKKTPAKKAATTAPASRPVKKSIAQNPYLGAIVVDAVTGKVLFEDKADTKGYPASVLKLMDLLIIQEKIEQNRLALNDKVTVSAKAAKTGGSQVWLAEKEVFTVDELLYALMIQSANDAAVALAEKLAGSTEAFVELMNKRAKELGMNNTLFQSVHGLPPAAGQQQDVTSARDFALLCCELMKHPDTLRYTSTREKPFRPNDGQKMVMMRTHNHLLGQLEGCDGLKTGYTATAGYSIAVTAMRNGKRLIVVVLGSSDRKTRDAKAAELIAKGMSLVANQPAPGANVPKK